MSCSVLDKTLCAINCALDQVQLGIIVTRQSTFSQGMALLLLRHQVKPDSASLPLCAMTFH